MVKFIQSAPSAVVPGDLYRRSLTAFAGDSITLRNGGSLFWGGLAYPTLACMLSGGFLKEYINAGVSGNRSDQLLARFATDVINAKNPKPGRCIVLIGTNDVSAGSGVTFAQSMVNIGAIYDMGRSAGIEMIGATIPPKDNLTHAAIGQMNAGIKNLCDVRGMHCVDFHSVLVDGANGNYKSGYTTDGTHPEAPGARAMANLAVSTLSPHYPASPFSLAQSNDDTTNLITNGFFIGDANSDGVADSWTLSAVNGTVTPTIETGDTNILGNWQVLTTTVTGQRILSQTCSRVASSPAGWAEGEWLEFSGIINVVGEAGTAWPSVRLRFVGPNITENPVYQCACDVTRGVFYRRIQVATGAAANNLSIELRNSDNSPFGTGTVKFAQMSLWNLTRLGLV